MRNYITYLEVAYKTGLFTIPIGVDANNIPVLLDFSKQPNMWIGGVPGTGKTELMRTMITHRDFQTASGNQFDPWTPSI